MVEPTLAAMANDLTQKDNRQQAFSLLYLGFNLGFAVGSLIAGYLFARHTPWIFISTAIASAIITVISIFFIIETIPKKENEEIAVLDDEKSEDGNLIVQNLGVRAAWPVVFVLEMVAAFSVYILYGAQKKKIILQEGLYM